VESPSTAADGGSSMEGGSTAAGSPRSWGKREDDVAQTRQGQRNCPGASQLRGTEMPPEGDLINPLTDDPTIRKNYDRVALKIFDYDCVSPIAPMHEKN